MPTRDGSASAARALSRKRRLHPLAIIFPLTSYSRPPLLGRSIRIPRWVWLSILFVVGLIGAMDWLPADDTDDWLHLALAVALLGGWYAAKREDDPDLRSARTETSV